MLQNNLTAMGIKGGFGTKGIYQGNWLEIREIKKNDFLIPPLQL